MFSLITSDVESEPPIAQLHTSLRFTSLSKSHLSLLCSSQQESPESTASCLSLSRPSVQRAPKSAGLSLPHSLSYPTPPPTPSTRCYSVKNLPSIPASAICAVSISSRGSTTPPSCLSSPHAPAPIYE
ncbi:hypothetical protein KP509_1Z194300 [Ceratopteris richardii]|nr:hypothetical protein KP509_1Z194300 [Ceratopteris richardii]